MRALLVNIHITGRVEKSLASIPFCSSTSITLSRSIFASPSKQTNYVIFFYFPNFAETEIEFLVWILDIIAQIKINFYVFYQSTLVDPGLWLQWYSKFGQLIRDVMIISVKLGEPMKNVQDPLLALNLD
jgi:hypothetical protein